MSIDIKPSIVFHKALRRSLTNENEKNMITEVITDHNFIISAFVIFFITIRETSQY